MTTRARQIAVIGAGAWGTALAWHLASRGARVRLWAFEPEVVASIGATRINERYLPGLALPAQIEATASLEEAGHGCEWVLFAVPSHAARAILVKLAPMLQEPVPIVSATKGIEEGSFKLMTQIMEEVLPQSCHESLAVLSGPSFATEVARGLPTAATLAGRRDEVVANLQQALMGPGFRIYRSADPIGVQLGGALKNVIAVAAGIVDGLGLGANARAALITRGLAEMVRLGAAMGADPRTFYGLSGIGDLVLTCTGELSRNHTVGVRLGRGESLDAILGTLSAVAEGVRTSRAAMGLADRHGVEMPIVREVHAVLFGGKPCRQAVADLMERSAKAETGW